MLKGRPFSQNETLVSSREARTRYIRLGTLVAASALGLALVIMVALAIVMLTSPLRVNIENAQAELAPDAPITVTTAAAGVEVVGVNLTESLLGPNGEVTLERDVPVTLIPAVGEFPLSPWRTSHVRRVDGSAVVAYDGVYEMEVVYRTRELAFPLPQDKLVTTRYSFVGERTPQVQGPVGATTLAYNEPLRIVWSAPVEDFTVEVTPAVSYTTRVDPADGRVTYVELIGAEPGVDYQVTVTEATGIDGRPLVAETTLTAQTAPLPEPLVGEARFENGNTIVLPWSEPISDFDFEITPEVVTVRGVDANNPSLTTIQIPGHVQGTEYTIRITEATSARGAPLGEASEFTIATPPPLVVDEVSPVRNSFGVRRDMPITITFTKPITDRARAEAAFSITPAVSGHFEWPAPNQMRFIPDAEYPELTEMTVAVQGGTRGILAEDGSYLDETWTVPFKTRPDKIIDVDLSRQLMVLYEGGQEVYRALVSTGVRGAETPTGEFLVQVKLPSTRMRGTNPSGISYDIPNVPWVLPFLGDYTIHGAPWRGQFGYPQSNGCVSMATSDAKFVYDWAPVGTPVQIHY